MSAIVWQRGILAPHIWHRVDKATQRRGSGRFGRCGGEEEEERCAVIGKLDVNTRL